MSHRPAHELAIVIASHNRRDLLRRCLDSLSSQTQAPNSFEVIVADDCSTDGTAEMVRSLEVPFRLRVLRLEKSGKSGAANAAVRAVDAPVCLFIDDDVIASPNLVAAHLAAHRANPKVIGIGALTQAPPTGRDWLATAHAKAWNRRLREMAAKEGDWTDCYGGNFSAPRAALLEVGGYSTDLPAVEDIELSFRLWRAGCEPRYLPDAHAVHDDDKPGNRILDDTRGFGCFCARFAEEHPTTRPKLLGWFMETTPREVTLRRLFLALRLSPQALAAGGGLLPRGAQDGWFGFVSRYTFWFGARRAMSRMRWAQTTRGVAVLMYHAFTDDDAHDRYVTRKRSFAHQMRLLAALRYRVMPLEELATRLREHRLLPSRAVAITIDDGYVDILQVAQPILRRHELPATIFLVSRRLGENNDWDTDGLVGGRSLLSIDEVRQMHDAGTRIGAHTRTHASLPDASEGAAAEEIEGSRCDLETALDEPVTAFAYPYGRLDDRTVKAVGEAGYASACTTEPRLVHVDDDPLRIPRLEVMGSDSLVRFVRKLWFGGA